MRPLDEWDRSDLQALIDGQVQEYLQLDYKASEALQNTDGKKAEIAKDVSAFANSAGGRIIYGIVEDKRYPTAIDAGSDPTKITKEWIENVILSGISPRVDGVRVKEIPVSPERAAYVVDIPQASSRAPHQARDKRYYKRYEFQSVPMEDYEVRDVMRRASKPDLVLTMTLDLKHFDDASDRMRANLQVRLSNRSDEPAIYATLKLQLDTRFEVDSIGLFQKDSEVMSFVMDGETYLSHQFNRNFAPSHHQPIYKEQTFIVATIPLRLNPSIRYRVGYDITSPGMHKQRHGFIINGREIQFMPVVKVEDHSISDDD